VPRVVLVVLAMTLISCGTDSVGQMPTTTQGFTMGLLTCEQDLFETSVYDYFDEAVGFPTISDAIDDFRSQDDWAVHEDWHSLTTGDLTSSPVKFTDERGWVHLVVYLIRWNETWLVGNTESCASA
jgi:hypothetical protein